MITGQEKPDAGTITIGETVKLGYVDQRRDALDANKTVWEEISGGNEMINLGKREMNSRAYCGAFNFKGADQQKKVGVLSGGERNRVHLAKILKSGANVLLLDEPTNDLDVETLRALEEALEDFAGCAVIISHDRLFLDRIATHILAFEGDSHVEWFEGNFEDYEEDKKRRLGIGFRDPAPDQVQEVLAVSRQIALICTIQERRKRCRHAVRLVSCRALNNCIRSTRLGSSSKQCMTLEARDNEKRVHVPADQISTFQSVATPEEAVERLIALYDSAIEAQRHALEHFFATGIAAHARRTSALPLSGAAARSIGRPPCRRSSSGPTPSSRGPGSMRRPSPSRPSSGTICSSS